MKTTLISLTAVLIAPFAIQAQIVLDDTFDIPTDGATRGNDAADPNDTAWWKADSGNDPGLSVVELTSPDYALQVDPGSIFEPFVGSFSGFTLTNVGDSITLTYQVRQLSQGGGGLIGGLYNDNGTPTTADNDNSADDDFGYHVNIGTPGGANNGSTPLLKETSSTGRPTQGTRFNITPTLSTGFAFGAGGFHDVTMVIEKTAATEATVSVSWSGDTNGNTIVGIDDGSQGGGAFFTFNEVMFASGSSNNWQVDNVVVTTNTIPEPSTYAAIMALGALGVLLIRRRRR